MLILLRVYHSCVGCFPVAHRKENCSRLFIRHVSMVVVPTDAKKKQHPLAIVIEVCSQWGVVPVDAVCYPLEIICWRMVPGADVALWSKVHRWRAPDIWLQQLRAVRGKGAPTQFPDERSDIGSFIQQQCCEVHWPNHSLKNDLGSTPGVLQGASSTR